jgi:cytochrome c-type biogenesis protein
VLVNLAAVFLAGLFSFLSPCVFSMVPIYLGILGSQSFPDHKRFHLLINGFAFCLGFTLLFISLGLGSSVLGNVLFAIKPWIARIGGVLIILYGVALTNLIKLPIFQYEWKPIRTNNTEKKGLPGAFLMGLAFGAGWSPCIGPILGSILTAIMVSQLTIGQSSFLLFVYSLGISLPFLLLSLGLEFPLRKWGKSGQIFHYIQQVSGYLLIIFGLLLSLGLFSRLANWTPKWLL